MGLLKKINTFRRRFMRGITRGIGKAGKYRPADPVDQTKIRRVLISRPNGRLGNLLLITPLLQEVTAVFPDCRIDLFVKGNKAPAIFKHYPQVNTIIRLPGKPFRRLIRYIAVWITLATRHYDLVINAVENSSSGRLSARVARAPYKIFGDMDENAALRYDDYAHIAKKPVYTFREYFAGLGIVRSGMPVPPLDLRLSPSEIAEGQALLKHVVDNGKKTIALFTYATGEKCYTGSWWERFYGRLKEEYPAYNIIEILPFENISKISFRAPSFYSTDIRRIGSVIANTVLFIGADSGIMHLASAVHTPTAGLFSVTRQQEYHPYGNHSTAIDTNDRDQDACIRILNRMLAGE